MRSGGSFQPGVCPLFGVISHALESLIESVGLWVNFLRIDFQRHFLLCIQTGDNPNLNKIAGDTGQKIDCQDIT